MKGYRTLILAMVQVTFGALSMAGVTLSDELAATLATHIETALGAAIAISGVVMGIMRMITDSKAGPVAAQLALNEKNESEVAP